MKKKILFCSEATYLSTGYAVVFSELINRFHQSGRYEVAEHASYGKLNDPRRRNVPWRFYANSVDDGDPREQLYNSKESHKFGEWRFDKVALDFRPDIVCGFKDVYMDAHTVKSPLAPFYHKILAPPIDSHPQRDEFLELYRRADAVFSHTEYGGWVLRNEIPSAKYKGVVGCGVDLNTFYPQDKASVRQKYGISPDLFIVGTVMRNQRRKLFPNLIEGFKLYLDSVGSEQRKKSYLYLHTAYPDKEGWNLPKIIKEFGVGSQVISSYICKLCGHAFVSVFQDARIPCPACGRVSATMPNSNTGFTREQLAEVYNLFDLYLQVATCEGFGVPVPEAAACGVKVGSIDFGVMGEVIDKVGGYKIKPVCIQRDLENDAYRCFPDNQSIADVIKVAAADTNFDPEEQIKKTIRHFNIADMSQRLLDYADTLELPNLWNRPHHFHAIPNSFPANLNEEEFTDFLFNEVLNEPHERNSYEARCMERDLYYGIVLQEGKVKPLDRQIIFNNFRSLALYKQQVHRIRLGQVTMPREDFLEIANT